MEAAKKQTRERGDGRGDSGGRRGREKAHAGGEKGRGERRKEGAKQFLDGRARDSPRQGGVFVQKSKKYKLFKYER